MGTQDATPSPLERAAGAAGPQAIEAFKLLGDETRLAILLALWEAYDPAADDNALSFSTLYERAGVRDSGNFTYHLDKLIGHFVDAVDTGYRLRHAGLKIVRAVIAGSGFEDRRLPRSEVPRSCYHCGGTVELAYDDERLYQICSECEGNIGPASTERAPVGTLVAYDDFNPAGLADRSAGQVFVAGTIEYVHGVKLLIRGVCPECSGRIEEALHICESHDAAPGELCPSCGTSMRGGWNEARVTYVCSVCKHTGSYPAWAAVFDHPEIVSFYHDHGVDMTFGLDDPEACGRLWDHLKKEQSLVSTDPVRIRVTVSCDGDQLHLTLDGELDVVDVDGDERATARYGAADASDPPSARDAPTPDDREGMDAVELPDRDDCLMALRRQRWPAGVTCPRCRSSNTIRKGTTSKGARRYLCHGCGRKFNDLTGTLFAGHQLSIPEMIYILRRADQTAIAPIARMLGRSYKPVLEFVHEARADGTDAVVRAAVERSGPS